MYVPFCYLLSVGFYLKFAITLKKMFDFACCCMYQNFQIDFFQGHCKRYGHHPCDITRTHPCCCGDCTKDTVSIAISSILILKDFNFQTDPANANCFKEFLHIKHEHERQKKKKKKNGKSKFDKMRRGRN